jgi:hypothetical protein
MLLSLLLQVYCCKYCYILFISQDEIVLLILRTFKLRIHLRKGTTLKCMILLLLSGLIMLYVWSPTHYKIPPISASSVSLSFTPKIILKMLLLDNNSNFLCFLWLIVIKIFRKFVWDLLSLIVSVLKNVNDYRNRFYLYI